MKRILSALLPALALAVAMTPALAQSARDFPTPNLGERVPLMLQGCLNASGQAVPVSASCAYQAGGGGTASTVTANQGTPATTPWPTAEQGSALASVGIVPGITTSGTALLGKGSAGNLYGAYAYNTSTTAGFLVTANVAAVPASGAAVSPIECVPLPASGSAMVNYGAGPPDAYSAGIVVLTSTSCTTYTPSTIAAFIKARVR